jgi:hypothetical protein
MLNLGRETDKSNKPRPKANAIRPSFHLILESVVIQSNILFVCFVLFWSEKQNWTDFDDRFFGNQARRYAEVLLTVSISCSDKSFLIYTASIQATSFCTFDIWKTDIWTTFIGNGQLDNHQIKQLSSSVTLAPVFTNFNLASTT